MSFFCTALKSALLSRLRDWRTWLLLLLPLLVLGARLALAPEETAAPVRVGVVLPPHGGEEFWARLEERSGLVTEFILSDGETARRQVAAGRWDCALLLPEDFERRLERLDSYHLITLLAGPGSTACPLVRESAGACLFELMGPGVAERYLLDSGIADETTIGPMRPRLREQLLERDRVRVSLETADGRALDPVALADRGTDRLLAGLTAVVLLVWTLSTALDLGRWLDSPLARRLLPLRGPTALLLPRLAGALAPALCAGCLALTAAGCPAGIPALLAYLLFWGAAALLLCRRRALLRVMPVLMPFVPAAALLLSPVLADPTVLFPALAPALRWLPLSLFLEACSGQSSAAIALAGAGAIMLAAAFLPMGTGKSLHFRADIQRRNLHFRAGREK